MGTERRCTEARPWACHGLADIMAATKTDGTMQAWGCIRVGRVGAALGLVMLLAGCSSYDSLFGAKPSAATNSSSSSFSDRFNNILLGTPATAAAEGGGAPPPELDCPTVEIRQGASTFSQSAQD